MAAQQKNSGNICPICLRRKSGPIGPFCNGHKAASGGASGGGSSDADSANENAGVVAGVGASGVGAQKQAHIPNSARPQKEPIIKLTIDQMKFAFDQEAISKMLADKTLIIKNDREAGILSVTCLPHLLSEKQKDQLNTYANALLQVFEQFKRENNINGFSPQIKRDEKGRVTGLVMTLPRPELYDKFITTLASMNLLPQQIVNGLNQPNYEKNANHFAKTPFSMKPQPGAGKKRQEDESHSARKPKTPNKMDPFNIHRGPKPKGEV